MVDSVDISDGERRAQEVYELGNTLKDSGVNAVFLGDTDHAFAKNDIGMTLAMGGFEPDLVFVEVGAEMKGRYDARGTNAGDVAADIGAEVVPVDPWSEAKKNNYYEMSDTAGRLLKENGALAEQYDQAIESGQEEEALEIYDRMASRKAEFEKLSDELGVLTEERGSDAVNRGVASNMADSIEEFHTEHGVMPRFTWHGGDYHIKNRNDVDEMLMEELEGRGLPTDQYKSHKEIQFKEGKEGSDLDIDKKLLGEHEYKVSIPPTAVADVKASQGEGVGQSADQGM